MCWWVSINNGRITSKGTDERIQPTRKIYNNGGVGKTLDMTSGFATLIEPNNSPTPRAHCSVTLEESAGYSEPEETKQEIEHMNERRKLKAPLDTQGRRSLDRKRVRVSPPLGFRYRRQSDISSTARLQPIYMEPIENA
jgi:hypothetical protein